MGERQQQHTQVEAPPAATPTTTRSSRYQHGSEGSRGGVGPLTSHVGLCAYLGGTFWDSQDINLWASGLPGLTHLHLSRYELLDDGMHAIASATALTHLHLFPHSPDERGAIGNHQPHRPHASLPGPLPARDERRAGRRRQPHLAHRAPPSSFRECDGGGGDDAEQLDGAAIARAGGV